MSQRLLFVVEIETDCYAFPDCLSKYLNCSESLWWSRIRFRFRISSKMHVVVLI